MNNHPQPKLTAEEIKKHIIDYINLEPLHKDVRAEFISKYALYQQQEQSAPKELKPLSEIATDEDIKKMIAGEIPYKKRYACSAITQATLNSQTVKSPEFWSCGHCGVMIRNSQTADWTKPCECKEEDQHGETWCCNHCGRMTSNHSQTDAETIFTWLAEEGFTIDEKGQYYNENFPNLVSRHHNKYYTPEQMAQLFTQSKTT